MALLLALVAWQDPDLDRLRELVRALADDRVEARAEATRKIFLLPARLLPDLEAEAKKLPEAEVEAVVARLRIPGPWARVLRGTMGEARQSWERLSTPAHPEREASIRKALADLDALPAADVPGALEGLLALPDDETRSFALRCMLRVPPRDPTILAPFLRDAKTTGLAAEILVRMNDRALVPLAVDLFCEEGPGTLGAARVLEYFGAGERWPQVAQALRTHVGLLTWGIRILARSGPGAEDGLLELLEGPGRTRVLEIAQALADLESEKAAGPVRRALEAAGIEPNERSRLLQRLRDPLWAREWLDDARRDPNQLWRMDMDRLAAIGGPALRAPVVEWLLSAKQPVVIQTKLLPLLGAVGGREDAAFLATALSDPQLHDLAGDAVDRIGDPAHAPAVLRAWIDHGRSSTLLRVLLSFPPEGLEEELLRLFADPDRRSTKFPDGFRLVARHPTPRLRELLFRSLWNPQPIWAYHRLGAIRTLAGIAGKDDLPEIARLRADADPVRKAGGLALAARAGDEAAAKELARTLASGGAHPLVRRPDEIPLLLDAAAAGVREAWTARPAWKDGALWLARRGDREALDHLGRNPEWPGALAALAARGDDAALEALVRRADPGGKWTPDEERAFVAAAKPEHWRPMVALARKRNHPEGDPAFRAVALAARPEALDLFRAIVAKPIPPAPASEVYSRARSLSAAALGRLGDRDSLFLLRPLLRSPNALDRAAAARAIAELGDRDSIPRLVRLVDDPDEIALPDERPGADVPLRRVWHAAMEALEKLAGLRTEGACVAERRAFWRTR